jgi:type IV secretion system protein VirD4
VVSTSTKDDVYRATAIVRARNGRLWHYDPLGGQTLPGCIPLRWSPIPPSRDWATAIMLGKAMADIGDAGTSASGEAVYFRTKAGVLASALLHAAALEDKPMSWLMRAVSGNSACDED